MADARNLQCVRFAEKWLTYKEKVRCAVPNVRWYWGATGTGKSRAAATEANASAGDGGVFWQSGGKWWDGYDGHTHVIIDDFRPEQMKFAIVLRLLDRTPFTVEFKGGMRQLLATDMWITCPKPPSECYLDAGEELDQLLRRIVTIKQFE